MWPYGVNGAHEDNGTQNLYIANSLLAEALGEDGLAPTSGQFATPAYVFEQDDNTKYYLWNERLQAGCIGLSLRIEKSLAHSKEGDSAIHGSRVHINISDLGGQTLGHGTFAAGRMAVNGHDNLFHK